MSLSKIASKIFNGSSYSKINKIYYQVWDNIKMKGFERTSSFIDKNELCSSFKQKINEIKMSMLPCQNSPNQNWQQIKQSKLINTELLTNKIKFFETFLNQIVDNEFNGSPVIYDFLLKEDLKNIKYDNIPISTCSSILQAVPWTNSDNIPTITYHSILREALWTNSDNTDNLFSLNKKIVNTFDAFMLSRPDHRCNATKDLEAISTEFYEFLIAASTVEVVKMGKGNSIRIGRNSFAHDNYYSESMPDGMNITHSDLLKEHLSPCQQQELDKLDKNDWIVWSINPEHKEIKFCYGIKHDGLLRVFDEFKKKCNKMIIKSKRSQLPNSEAKSINDRNEERLWNMILGHKKVY